MAVKKGDIIDEFKRHPESCGLLIKIMAGGEGFQKVVCCDHDLTEEDVVQTIATRRGRKKGQLPMAVILDEKKMFPDSCGLRVMIMDGGAGFREIICCGHSLTLSSMRSVDLGQARGSTPPPSGPAGTA